MLRTPLLIILLAVSLPAVAGAQVHSSASATSNSGGNVVGPGGIIQTGNESASVQVTTTGSSSGTSITEISIGSNGAVHEEAVTTKGAATVSIEATPGKTTIKVQEGSSPAASEHQIVAPAQSETIATSTTTLATAEASTLITEEPQAGLAARIVLSIQKFFAGLLSWFA